MCLFSCVGSRKHVTVCDCILYLHQNHGRRHHHHHHLIYSSNKSSFTNVVVLLVYLTRMRYSFSFAVLEIIHLLRFYFLREYRSSRRSVEHFLRKFWLYVHLFKYRWTNNLILCVGLVWQSVAVECDRLRRFGRHRDETGEDMASGACSDERVQRFTYSEWNLLQ